MEMVSLDSPYGCDRLSLLPQAARATLSTTGSRLDLRRTADAVLLADTAEIASAYRDCLPIFPRREWRGRERSQDEKTS
jgi:hypothetical protein